MSDSLSPATMLAYEVNPALEHFNRLTKYYVNMDVRADRRAVMEQLFPTPAAAKLSAERVEQDAEGAAPAAGSYRAGQEVPELGGFVPFYRWVACNGKEEQQAGRLTHQFANDIATTHYQIPCTPGQQGCTISHYQIYRDIVDNPHIAEDEWVLVAEDDNNFIAEFPVRLNSVLAQLKQPRFARAQIAVLRYCEFKEHCDFVDELYSWKPNGEVHYTDPRKREFFHPDFFEAVRCRSRKKSSWSFGFPVEAPAHPQGLYGTNFTFMVPVRMIPWSSSLYLIRKSACRQICNNYPRPWWVADDFQALFPEHQTLLVSPVFAVDYDNTLSQSDIQNTNQTVRSRRARVFNEASFQRQRKERRLQFLLKYYYGTSRKRRNLARGIYKLAKLETKFWDRHDLP